MLRRLLRRLTGRAVRVRRPVRLPCTRLGTAYGGYWCCLDGLDARSIVYSFGIGEDISFDRELIARCGLTVHAFDPTPAALAWARTQELPPSFHLHPFGVAAFDGTARFRAPRNPAHVSHAICANGAEDEHCLDLPVYRLSTILHRLGHERVDLIKMDVEGAEYAVLEDLVASRIDAPQLLVEFHHGRYGYTRADTERALARLEEAGYRVFHVADSDREFSLRRC